VSLSISTAVNYLIIQANTATSGKLVNGEPVIVSDGPYTDVAFGMLVVGLSDPSETGAVQPITVGRQMLTLGLPLNLSEQLDIPCFIDVRIPDTQAAARTEAEAIFNAFNNLLLADPSASGQFVGGQALVTSLYATPSLVGTAAEQGRRFLISFTVQCTHITQ